MGRIQSFKEVVSIWLRWVLAGEVVLGLIDTTVGQVAPDPSTLPRVADYLPTLHPSTWLAILLGTLVIGMLEGAHRAIFRRDVENADLRASIEAREQNGTSRVSAARRTLRGIERYVRSIEANLPAYTGRTLVDDHTSRELLTLRKDVKAQLENLLMPAIVYPVFKQPWRTERDRIAAPPKNLLRNLANDVRNIADSLEEHDLRSDDSDSSIT